MLVVSQMSTRALSTVRLSTVAHSCYDYRMPGKGTDVSFAVTRLDMERGVAGNHPDHPSEP